MNNRFDPPNRFEKTLREADRNAKQASKDLREMLTKLLRERLIVQALREQAQGAN